LYSLKFEQPISKARGTKSRALAFSPDGAWLAVGRDDKRVAVLKAETGALEKESDPFDAEVSALVWPTSSLVAVGRADGAVSGWAPSTNQRGPQWVGATSRVNSLAASGGRLAAGTHDGQGWLWSLERAGAAELRVPADASEVEAVGFRGEGLVLCGTDRLVHVLGL
jgi:WD40 repeat protein